jgi:hypothetical protein
MIRFLLSAIFVLSASHASAQYLRPSLPLDQIRQQEQRALWRPEIRVLRPDASRKLPAGIPLTYAFACKRGFISRIELRSGARLIRVIQSEATTDGTGTVTVMPDDLLRIGKNRTASFALWVWQGVPGYQSVHGESISYTLAP